MFMDEVKDCSKCGKCRSVCPVFLQANDEVMSPRGRVSLVEAMLDGGLSNSERYVDTIRSCIKCMRCSDACPVGIRVERVVQSARELLAQKLGVPDPASEVFRSLLLNPSAFRFALVNAGKASANLDAGDRSALAPLWQLPLFFHEGARLPELAADTVLDKYPEYIDAGGEKRIALFVGCSVNYVHTEIADSAIEVLKRFNVDIFLPKDQLCCGTPVLLFGDMEGVRELAKRNMRALKADEFDAVVTLCPACGVTFKREYERILDSDIEGFSSKVYDLSEFIGRFVDYGTHKIDATVTYHDPCYLRLGQEVEAEPRRLLKSSARFIEMKDADKCCGLGCTLGLFHPEVSMKMGEAKVRTIEESGADMVATGCPGCIVFLREQLAERGINRDILHTVQVFQKSLETR